MPDQPRDDAPGGEPIERTELEQRVASFPRWHQHFQLPGGVETPAAAPGLVNRQRGRRAYFFAALLELLGGSLEGQRVLDLGCNAGFWSLQALDAGAAHVLGVDIEPRYLEQAQLVFSACGVDPERYRFEAADVFELQLHGGFDVVLCLGLLEVTARPVELFALIARSGARVVVIDTALSGERGSSLELAHADDPRDRAHEMLVLIPSAAAVVEMAGEHAYETVALAHNMSDYTGMEDYRRRLRAAFIAGRDLPLGRLRSAPSTGALPWWWPASVDPSVYERLRAPRRASRGA